MSRKNIGVVRFLGTNCDRDVWQAVEDVGLTPQWIWYEDLFNPSDFSAIILPGGFSYGDYIRGGALASRAPVMKSVKQAADKGLPVLGICNGFQILCESGILPGVLLKNQVPRFIDQWVRLEKVNNNPYWNQTEEEVYIPIAHGEGRFYVDNHTLKSMQDNGQIWLTYKENPNGSVSDIAGITNAAKNVAGLMPHPERAMHKWMGGEQGREFFMGLIS
mgnify:CR=1 FL=1